MLLPFLDGYYYIIVAKIGIILVMTKLWANVSQKLHECCTFCAIYFG